jgi:hypothetical protein
MRRPFRGMGGRSLSPSKLHSYAGAGPTRLGSDSASAHGYGALRMSARDSLSAAPRLAAPSYERFTTGVGPFVLAGAGFVAVLITHLVDFGSDGLRVGVLNADSDASWSHRLIAATLVAATAVAAVNAWRSRERRGLWAVVAGILAFLAVDELSSLHTQVDQMAWGKALYGPILLVLGVCLWRLAARRPQGLVLRVGVAILFLSFGIHVFGPHIVHALGYGTDSWPYQVKVALKQGTELAGWLLVFIGLWRPA